MRPLLVVLLLTCNVVVQDDGAKSRAHRMEITLERHDGNEWKAADPGYVFEKDDRVRFRANFDGFLY